MPGCRLVVIGTKRWPSKLCNSCASWRGTEPLLYRPQADASRCDHCRWAGLVAVACSAFAASLLERATETCCTSRW